MKKNILLSPLLVLFSAGILFSQGKPGNPFDVIRYEFIIRINDSTDIIYSQATSQVRFTAPSGIVGFDFRSPGSDGRGMKVSLVTVNGKNAGWRHEGGKLVITCGENFSAGSAAVITVVYSGIPADGLIISKNRFGSRTFFSDHWPDRASYYLPVVDHPSDKAQVDFVIIAPVSYQVVAAGILTEQSNVEGNSRLTRWHEEVPLPVKVMAFGAAGFATQLAGFAGEIPVWTWVYPENRKEGFNDYAPAVKALSFFEEMIGPYPFKKMASVQSKTIFGGLENASCIFYSENSVTGHGRAESLIAHEMVHQWFGNSVTEKDWQHIWLSEGFATYLTAVYLEMNYGRERFVAEMKQARDRLLRYYDKNPSPVIDTLNKNPMNLLNANSYQKGAWVLHMLRCEIGDEKFFKGVRLFYQRFRNSNAETSDFRKVMEEVSDKDLDLFFRQWLVMTGQPELLISTKPGRKGFTDIVIRQKQADIFSFPLDLLVKGSDGDIKETVRIRERNTVISVKEETIKEIIPDPGTRLLFRNAER